MLDIGNSKPDDCRQGAVLRHGRKGCSRPTFTRDGEALRGLLRAAQEAPGPPGRGRDPGAQQQCRSARCLHLADLPASRAAWRATCDLDGAQEAVRRLLPGAISLQTAVRPEPAARRRSLPRRKGRGGRRRRGPQAVQLAGTETAACRTVGHRKSPHLRHTARSFPLDEESEEQRNGNLSSRLYPLVVPAMPTSEGWK